MKYSQMTMTSLLQEVPSVKTAETPDLPFFFEFLPPVGVCECVCVAVGVASLWAPDGLHSHLGYSRIVKVA